jgi:predicted amidohydrolase
MKICVAQTRPIKGDVLKNIENHTKLINMAVANGVDFIVFPELSLTSYEPALANELATSQNDSRFDTFQQISNSKQIAIGVGVPTKNDTGICISMAIFQPHKKRQLYSKKYLHPDEDTFFVSGQNLSNLIINETKIALAICYELSIPEHSENAFRNGDSIYIASVAKTAVGVEKAIESLSDIARKYAMTVLFSNCVGYCDNFESAGNSAILSNKGIKSAQLNDTDEGILIFDTDTQHIVAQQIIEKKSEK